jgi:hypothetical protein
MTDPYEELGLSGDASDEEVKKKFKQLANIHHPDKPGGDEEAFKKLKAAYEAIVGGAKPDNLEADAMARLHDCFDQMLNQVDPFTVDIVEQATGAIQTALADLIESLADAKSQRKKFKKLVGKMKTKTVVNLFELLIFDKIVVLNKGIERTERDIKVLTRMLALLKDYEYSYESPIDRFSTGVGVSRPSGSGWAHLS